MNCSRRCWNFILTTRRYRDDDFINYTGVSCPCSVFDGTQDNRWNFGDNNKSFNNTTVVVFYYLVCGDDCFYNWIDIHNNLIMGIRNNYYNIRNS